MSFKTSHYIAGRFTDDEPSLPVENPATGQELTKVADASPEQAMTALDAAVDAAEGFAATEPRYRAELLRSAYEAITARADEFAETMTLEMGKPLEESRGEVTYGAEFLRWFAEETPRVYGRWSTAPSGGSRLLTMKQPVGPVLAITPWNFPLAMATRKLGPAIAAGCTSVLKPAQLTPLTALLLMDVFDSVGLPAGVVNCFVSSDSAATTGPIIADPRLRKLTFTGSTGVGVTLLEQAATNVLRTSMELGGNAPFLVLAGADVDRAVEGAIVAKMRNIGQACTAANRFIVHHSHYEEFATKFARRVSELVIGNGMDDGVKIGPLVSAGALDGVESVVREAIDAGARALVGGSRIDRPGHFMEPTVLVDVDPASKVFREEIFGPVAPIVPVGSTDEAIALANDTAYGLMSYAYTGDLDEGLTVSERLQFGMVGLNTGLVSNPAAPFGGVKASGLGREGGPEGINEYLEIKYVGIGMK